MQAGRLDRRVEVLRNTPVTDSFNAPRENWSVHATRWGGKQDLAGRKDVEAQQINPLADTRFWFRWCADLLVTDRLRLDGQEYDILHVGEVGRRDGLSVLSKVRPR